MSDKLSVEALPSPESHNEPSKLFLRKEIKKRLMQDAAVFDLVSSEDSDNEDTFNIQQADTSEAVTAKELVASIGKNYRNPLEILAEAIKHTDANELVEVYGPFGRITFRAMHVTSNPYGLAFVVSKDHMTYEPMINTSLTIKCGGASHEVVYAGGYFTFRQMPFTFLTFIKITEGATNE